MSVSCYAGSCRVTSVFVTSSFFEFPKNYSFVRSTKTTFFSVSISLLDWPHGILTTNILFIYLLPINNTSFWFNKSIYKTKCRMPQGRRYELLSLFLIGSPAFVGIQLTLILFRVNFWLDLFFIFQIRNPERWFVIGWFKFLKFNYDVSDWLF